ncbi:hypothetical protein Yalta_155 [Yalta virus]|nr:hypothetical protein Yalta_155 [Yalta virus]
MDYNNLIFYVILMFIIILLIILIVCFLGFSTRSDLYFHPLSLKELDSLVPVEDKLTSLRKSLQDLFFETLKSNKIKKASEKDLKLFLDVVFTELNLVVREYKENGIVIQNENEFLGYFFEYIKDTRLEFFMSESLYNTFPFIKNMGNVVYHKHKYAIRNIKKNKEKDILEYSLETETFETYVKRLGLFLSNYRNTAKNGKFITTYEKKNNLEITTQPKFKKALVFIWRLGSYICLKIERNENIDNEVVVFDKYFLYVFDMCCKEKKFPFGYDWFLFVSHYSIILSYKLYIDYRSKNTIDVEYIKEIFKFLPKVNYSLNIRRYKSNVAIMSISFIIAHLFKNKNNIKDFHNFMNDFIKSEIYKQEVVINYQEPKNNKLEDGLYIDGGFITHRNLVSYNYLIAYLYPSLFYKIMFNIEDGNIGKIFKTLKKFVLPTRKVNPVIVSRYGKLDELNNALSEFIEKTNQIQIKYNNIHVQKYIDAKNHILNETLGVKVVESARIVFANFESWSIQLKINSELAYGEVDIYNKQILKQISMNKIMLFDDTEFNEFQNHSFYPGVLSYKKYLDNSESFVIPYGTNTFTFETVKYTYKQLDKDTIIIYSLVFNKETKIGYEEFIMITKYGIIIGYFNIKCKLEDELNVTISSPLIKDKTTTSVLFSDDQSSPFQQNNAVVKKVQNHVLYSNLIIGAPKIHAKVEIKKNIHIDIEFDKKYKILLNNKIGLQVY